MTSYESHSFEGGDIITTAVAVDKDKNSQLAVKWAIEKLKLKDNGIILVHVRTNHSFDSQDVPRQGRDPTPAEMQQLFLQFRGFCARKGVQAKEVIVQDIDVADALSNYIITNSITTIVLGASSRSALARAFKSTDVPSSIAKHAPDSCTVYVVSKSKTLKLKSSSQSDTPSSTSSSVSHSNISFGSPARTVKFHPQESWKSTASELQSFEGGKHTSPNHSREYQYHQQITSRVPPVYKTASPQNSMTINEFLQGNKKPTSQESTHTSYESINLGSNYSSSHDSGPGSSGSKNNISAILQSMNNLNLQVRTKDSLNYSVSGSSDNSGMMSFPSDVSFEVLDQGRISNASGSSSSSLPADIEDELRKLKHEMKQITLKYNVACQEAGTAKDKMRGTFPWSSDGSIQEEANPAQEAAMAIVEREKLKCKAAIEAAHKAQRIAELESEKRRRAEMKFRQEHEDKQKAVDALAHCEVQYRKYTMDEIATATDYFSASIKVGEGGYGPVFKATLDHTAVAIKVLRPDMSQGEKQFQREVEVLSRMRHPHMVILMGACPEYGCLVYEYLENGSLEDRLYRKNGSRPLPWSARFRIAAEIATALNFLHCTRPEPLVHRDLKPANILLDKNFVSKISDVGLARLVPPSIADTVTQYHMTAAAGTFCYIDPEYQQTGMLGTKSDIYSLGVMFLQIITAKPPMGLTHHVETAIETGKFAEILDPTVKDWPVDEALTFAQMALRCCELRRKDRPDLDSEILPELERLRDLGSRSFSNV